MILKFIGKDGSMGLEHGKKYKVWIDTSSDGMYICVHWQGKDKPQCCPYSSPQSLAKNWEK